MNIYRNQSSPFFYCTPLYSGTCAGCGAAPSSPSCPGEYPVPYSASQWLVEPSWYKSGAGPTVEGKEWGSPRMKLR